MKTTIKKIKVAIAQSAPIIFDLQKTFGKLSFLTKQARQKGADIVVFPEVFLGGYPQGADFGVKIGFRKMEGRYYFQKYYDTAIDIKNDTEEMDFLRTVALENEIYLVTGVVEKELGTLYCSVFFFNPEGKFLGKHRKLVPTAMERVIWGQGDKSTMTVLNTEIGNIGAAICWENYIPLYRTYLYSQGIQIYCAPTVEDRDFFIHTVKHIALEGRCFVLSACQFMKKENFPEGTALNDDPNILIRGGSCIINPFGEVLAGPVYNQECIITADIDLNEITRGKFDLDVTGHYARPDIFQLSIK